MVYYLDDEHQEWPAQERLCNDLGISFCRARGEGAPFTALGAAFAFLARKPWQWLKLFSVLSEYWECKYYLLLLRGEADIVRTEENDRLVRHILRQAGQNLIREPSVHWSELCGLYSQKLVHLAYYDAFFASEGANHANATESSGEREKRLLGD